MCVCMCVCVCICVCVCMYICMYVYMYVCICMARVCVCVCVCVCTCDPKTVMLKIPLQLFAHTQKIILTSLRVILNTRSQAPGPYTDQLLSCLTLRGRQNDRTYHRCKLAGNIARICPELHYKGIHMLSQHSLLNHSLQ